MTLWVRSANISSRYYSSIPTEVNNMIFKRKMLVPPRKSSHQKEFLNRLARQNKTLFHIISRASTGSTGIDRDRQNIHKSMFDSYVEQFLRFKSDPSICEEYLDVNGKIQIGKILEDFDSLAGSIAYLHCEDGHVDSQPLTIVTASLDRIDLLSDIPLQDVKLSGNVTYVGKSSMEVMINMEKCDGTAPPEGMERVGIRPTESVKPLDRLMTARFIMVALNKQTRKPEHVPQLNLVSDEERTLYMQGAEHKARKQIQEQISLEKKPPSNEELELIHSLYLENSRYLDPKASKPPNIVWMKDTIQQSLVRCMPQDRNMHNKIFGGFLMRLAFELAYSTGLLFASNNLVCEKSTISFVALDDIVFRKPVNIGSLLSLTSQVVYSPGNPSRTIQIKVKADVMDPILGTRDTTNTFHFTFRTTDANTPLPRVIPRSYDESMRYIEGRRRKERWLKTTSVF